MEEMEVQAIRRKRLDYDATPFSFTFSLFSIVIPYKFIPDEENV